MGTFLHFAYFSSCLQTKETAWKRGDAIFSELEMIWSSLGQFWKILVQIKQLKSLMVVSLTLKLRAAELLGIICGYMVNNFELKILSIWLRLSKKAHMNVRDTYEISFLFNEQLKSYSSLYFTALSSESLCHTFASLGTT